MSFFDLMDRTLELMLSVVVALCIAFCFLAIAAGVGGSAFALLKYLEMLP